MTRKPSQTEHTLSLPTDPRYIAVSEWQTLFDQEKPVAFHVVYLRLTKHRYDRSRSSSWRTSLSLPAHGSLGPAHLFRCQRQPAQTSSTVVDNGKLADITDLVFIDPIGTGFSSSLPQDKDIQDKSGEKANPSQADKPKETEFGSRAGLESLGNSSRVSRQKRWLSPIFIAGESYGGFRR